jgi:hypothetical protein
LADLKIPERFRSGLLRLAKLPDAGYEELLAALNRAPSSFTTNRELAVWISSEVPGVSGSDIRMIVESLTSLYRVRVRSERTVPRVAADIAASVREFESSTGPAFEGRLTSLLALPVLNVASVKAKELRAEGERIYCDAKILTDVRPVFGDGDDTSVTASIIVHTLKLGFHVSGPSAESHRELFVSLDSKDIVELKKVLERAEDKEKSLRTLLEATNTRLIDLE